MQDQTSRLASVVTLARLAPRQVPQFLLHLVRRFVEDNCQSTAAALTYQTLFAVVPLLTVSFAVFNSFEAFSGLSGKFEALLFDNVVPENVGVVQDYLRDFSAQANNLSVPSLIFLAVTAFFMLFTIEKTFNEIWGVYEPRQGFQRFLMYWAVLSLGPLLVGVGFVISTYVMSLPLITDVSEYTGGLTLVPIFLSASMFTLIYAAVPNCPVPFKYALVGGVIVALMFELAKFLFAYVMSRSNFQVIYGAFAAVPLFLLWIYISWTIVLLGAQLVKGLSLYRPDGGSAIEPAFFQVLVILEMFYRAHVAGSVIKERDIRENGNRIDLEQWNNYKRSLIELNLIRNVDKGGLVLSRDLSEISVWDLYRSLAMGMPLSINGQRDWEQKLAERFNSIREHDEGLLGLNLEALFRSSADGAVNSDAVQQAC